MNKEILNRFRRALVRHRDSLRNWLSSDSSAKERCLCGEGQKCEATLHAHDAAIACIDRGDFGICTVCGEDMAPERLEMDFTASVCLEHYSQEKLRALERDLELAAKVQQQLLPAAYPALPEVDIAAMARPAQIVGGDYYDFFCTPAGLQGFAIADVMGKGLPASMLMSSLQASLRIIGPEYQELPDVAARLNELFRYNLKLIRFITLFLCAVDPQKQQIVYTNAGHHPPLLRKRSGEVEWLNPTGPAIGLIHAPEYKASCARFGPGDMLLLYTDGLLEARNELEEEFGEERLAGFAHDHANGDAKTFLARLHREVERFTGGKIHDDLTLLVLKAVENSDTTP